MIQRLIQEKWFQLVKTLFVSRDVLAVAGILRKSIKNCHSAIFQVNVLLEYMFCTINNYINFYAINFMQ